MRLPIVTGDLLELADTLAAMTPARPQTIHLRRAVSSASYAVFHELVAQATRRTFDADPARQAERYTLTIQEIIQRLRTPVRRCPLPTRPRR